MKSAIITATLGGCARRWRSIVVAALLVLGTVGCAKPGGTGISVGPLIPVPSEGHSGVWPFAVASDGSLWFERGKDLVQLRPNGAMLQFPLAPNSVDTARLVDVGMAPFRSGIVWFVARLLPPEGQRDESGSTLVGQVGPQGVVMRTILPGANYREPISGATDGALWMGQRRVSVTTAHDSSSVDDLVRVGPDGRQALSRLFPSRDDSLDHLDKIAAGRDGTVWVSAFSVSQERQQSRRTFRVGPSAVLNSWPIDGALMVPRPDGGLALLAEAADRDACLVASIGPDGGTSIDQAHPLMDNTPRHGLYGRTYGCLDTYAGADGSRWVSERPRTYPHTGGPFPEAPWHVFRVSPGGQRAQWVVPSGTFVQAMAPAPHDAMWFIANKPDSLKGELGVITSAGHVSERLASLPDYPIALLPTGETTLYLVAENGVSIITVPAK